MLICIVTIITREIAEGLDEFEWRWLKRNETLGKQFSKPLEQEKITQGKPYSFG